MPAQSQSIVIAPAPRAAPGPPAVTQPVPATPPSPLPFFPPRRSRRLYHGAPVRSLLRHQSHPRHRSPHPVAPPRPSAAVAVGAATPRRATSGPRPATHPPPVHRPCHQRCQTSLSQEDRHGAAMTNRNSRNDSARSCDLSGNCRLGTQGIDMPREPQLITTRKEAEGAVLRPASRATLLIASVGRRRHSRASPLNGPCPGSPPPSAPFCVGMPCWPPAAAPLLSRTSPRIAMPADAAPPSVGV